MSWTDFLIDKSKIISIYGNKIPSLQEVDLHEVILNRDGPRIVLRFDLPEFPDSPPKKWLALGFNRVQVQLMVLNIHELAIENFSTECKCNIIIYPEKDFFSLIINDNGMKINVVGEHLILNEISAYISSPV